MDCPMCGLGSEHQAPDPEDSHKTKCKGCGTKFYDKTKMGM
jgi:transposase-like protein